MIKAADESACKPGSVPRRERRSGDHPSRTIVAGGLQRSTRELGRAALERSLSDLAPGGVCRAARVTPGAGGLLHRRFTLTGPSGDGPAVCSLWHCPAGHPGWALPTTLPCGARTFLGEVETSTRPSGRLVRRAARVPVAPGSDVPAGTSGEGEADGAGSDVGLHELHPHPVPERQVAVARGTH